jgi:CHAD domain-containing protein
LNDLLNPEQRIEIERIIAGDAPALWQRCGRILLLYDDGLPTRQVAPAVGLSRSRVRYWRRRFWAKGLDMFPEDLRTFQNPTEAEGRSETIEVLNTQSQTSEVSRTLNDSSQKSETLPIPAGKPEPGEEEPHTEESGTSFEPALLLNNEPSLPEFIATLKGQKGPGVAPLDSLAEAGRKVLRFHFAQMLLHEDGTLQGDDIEELHDMRVATRRMRAAFEVFGDAYKKKALRPHLKRLRATGRALGQVRDLDVFMEKAHAYLKDQPEGQSQGLRPLLRMWEQDRESKRTHLVAYLKGKSYADFKEEFYNFLSTPGEGAQPIPQDEPVPYLVRDVAPVLIYTRLAAADAFETILHNATLEQLHTLRIEFKKLRYSVEFFQEVLGKQAKEVIGELKKLQDHLGDLHDAQVATQILRDFLGQWDLHQASLPVSERQSPEPIMAYLSARYAERYHLMVTFQDAWECFTSPEFRRNLALAVSEL